MPNALLEGQSGGQTLNGGTAAGEPLVLQSAASDSNAPTIVLDSNASAPINISRVGSSGVSLRVNHDANPTLELYKASATVHGLLLGKSGKNRLILQSGDTIGAGVFFTNDGCGIENIDTGSVALDYLRIMQNTILLQPNYLNSYGLTVAVRGGANNNNNKDLMQWQDSNVNVLLKINKNGDFTDDLFTIANASDITKKLLFNLSSLNTGQVRTVKPPTADGTLLVDSQVPGISLRKMLVPASAFIATPSLGGSFPAQYPFHALPGNADTGFIADFLMPSDYNGGNVEWSILYANNGTSVNPIVYELTVRGVDSDELLTAAAEINLNSTDNGGGIDETPPDTAHKLRVLSIGIDHTGLAAGQLVRVSINRPASSNGRDTNTGQMNFVGLRIDYASTL